MLGGHLSEELTEFSDVALPVFELDAGTRAAGDSDHGQAGDSLFEFSIGDESGKVFTFEDHAVGFAAFDLPLGLDLLPCGADAFGEGLGFDGDEPKWRLLDDRRFLGVASLKTTSSGSRSSLASLARQGGTVMRWRLPALCLKLQSLPSSPLGTGMLK